MSPSRLAALFAEKLASPKAPSKILRLAAAKVLNFGKANSGKPR